MQRPCATLSERQLYRAMAMQAENIIYARLTSDAHARSIGHLEGKTLRDNGARLEELVVQREILEASFPKLRGPAVEYYPSWRRGFEAGYLGKQKP